MRTILSCCFIILGLSSIAGTLKDGEWIPRYRIVKDSLNPAIPNGEVWITGQVYEEVYDPVTGKNMKSPVPRAKISTIDQRVSCLSDNNGNYSFKVTPKDTSIYMFKSSMEEVVIYRHEFKNQHHLIIDFMPIPAGEMIITEKPVIYCYADNPQKVSIKLDPMGEFAFTYPEYHEGWEFTVSGNQLVFNDSASYPYLFWEAERNSASFHMNGDLIPGEYVQQDNVTAFLTKKLNDLGLNAKEKTDFITYWGPRITRHKEVFVQFLIDEDVASEIGDMHIEPTPHSILRVFMTFCNADEIGYYPTQEQLFEPITRKGLTVVEWGGSEVTKNNFRINP